jgi:hypothetical protein
MDTKEENEVWLDGGQLAAANAGHNYSTDTDPDNLVSRHVLTSKSE